MENKNLTTAIKNKALELGYQKCGIIKVEDMLGFAEKLEKRMAEYPNDRPFLERFVGFADIKKKYSWGESLIILVKTFGQYKIPKHLKGHIASAYLASNLTVKGSPEYQSNHAFGKYLSSLNIKAEADDKGGLTAMRWAAMQAGLGIIRKNNFFYTKNGSSALLTAWLIDKELELKEHNKLKPCPEECTKCVEACPTQALKAPYSIKPTACVAFISGFGGDDLPKDPATSCAMAGWIYGCDLCQLACPFNKIKTDKKIEYPGLDDFGKKVSLTQIIDMNYEELEKTFSENFWYISKARLWKWKVNSLNAMKNGFKDEYLPWIQKACDDPIKEVRQMANWVLENLK